jgi:hypothetical protein
MKFLRMILSEIRYPPAGSKPEGMLFRIMRTVAATCRGVNQPDARGNHVKFMIFRLMQE